MVGVLTPVLLLLVQTLYLRNVHPLVQRSLYQVLQFAALVDVLLPLPRRQQVEPDFVRV